MGLVEAPLEVTTLALTEQLSSIKVDVCTSNEWRIDWDEFFVDNGLNYNIMNNKIALFSAKDNLTVYTSTAADGWWTLYSNMMERNSFDGYFFSRTLKNVEDYYVFEMKIWHSGVLDRHVRTLKTEDGWEFLNKGSLGPFENVQLYGKRKISDRLNQEAIEIYSAAVGFPISSVVEYQEPGIIFTRP